ncbi:MAG: BBE domain-containing protein [Acidobacteriota bacterium]
MISSRPPPYATGGVYVNFMPSDKVDRIRQAYGDNYGRLVALKDLHHPANLFRLSHNIRPSMAAGS